MDFESDQKSLPDKNLVGEKVRQAREEGEAGELAYAWLKEHFHWPFVKLIDDKTGWGRDHAEPVAVQVWRDRRERILRAPEAGGYDPKGSLLFQSYLWKECCNPWREQYDRAIKPQTSAPTPPSGRATNPKDQEVGLAAVKPESRIARDSTRVDPTGRERDFADSDQPPPGQRLVDQEADEVIAEAMFLLMEMLFRPETGYPHQQLGFAFSKLIYGAPSARGIQGDPTRLLTEKADTALDKLTEEFEEAYTAMLGAEGWQRDRIRRAVMPLKSRLGQTLEQTFCKDPASRDIFAHLAAKHVSESTLNEYLAAWSKPAPEAVAEWCFRVRRNIVKGLSKMGLAGMTALLDHLKDDQDPR
jgi:hypothetical protein